MRKKIVFFIPSLTGGGAQKVLFNILNNIDKGKYKVYLIIVNRRGDVYSNYISKEIQLINLNKKSTKYSICALIMKVREIEPDILMGFLIHGNIIVSLISKFLKKKTKIVLSMHSVLTQKINSKVIIKIVDFFYKKADAIVTVSYGVKKDMVKVLNIEQEKFRVIYNPIVDSRLKELSKENVNHLWFTNNYNVIVAIGRLVPLKDYDTVLKTFAAVKEKNKRLIIFGDGKQKDFLLKLSKELKIEKQVEFMGFKENPYKYLSKARVFIQCSTQEGFGNTIVEAMACGVPVISTNCPVGPREIITDGVNGCLVRIGDYVSIAYNIDKILSNDSIRNKYIQNGLTRSKDFEIEKITKEYEVLFDELIDRKR